MGCGTSKPQAAPKKPELQPTLSANAKPVVAAQQNDGSIDPYASPFASPFSAASLVKSESLERTMLTPSTSLTDTDAALLKDYLNSQRSSVPETAAWANPQERERCKALKRLVGDVLSSEPNLDFICKLVSEICNVPVVVVALIDEQFTWVKSSYGLPEGSDRKADRRLAFAAWVLQPLNPEVIVVEDMQQDSRFCQHPRVVSGPKLRFFAAAPLVDKHGNRLGGICVLDVRPRTFDAEKCNVLCNFAEMVMRDLERQAISLQRQASVDSMGLKDDVLLRTMEECSDGIVLLDTSKPCWPILFVNEGWTTVTGLPPVAGSVKCFWDIFQVPGMSSTQRPWEIYGGAVAQAESFTLDVILHGSSGKHLFKVSFKPSTSDKLDEGMVEISVPAQPRDNTSPSMSRTTSSSLAPGKGQRYYFGTLFRPSWDSSKASTDLMALIPAPVVEDGKPPISGVKLGPLLGKGSFGSVHYGTWNGAQVAIKVIQHMATEEERQARDEQLEAILGLKMLHPNIVRTYQFATKERPIAGSKGTLAARLRPDGLDDSAMGTPNNPSPPMGIRRVMETWIVLELCNRGSLQEAIDKGAFKSSRDGPRSVTNMVAVLRTATEIAGAMCYLHSLDILHSDLNGNNILLVSNTGIDDRPFSVKVSDFGLSRIHIGERTVATQTYGTVTHMPPELLAEGRLSKAADVYAFGVLLWEMYTSKRPWSGLRHVQIITHKMRASQLQFPPSMPLLFKDLAQQCIAPDPHQRPTFAELLDKLEDLRCAEEQGRLMAKANSLSEDAEFMAALPSSTPLVQPIRE